MFNCHVFEVLNKEGKALLVKHTFLTKMYTTILFYICSKAKSLANLAFNAMNAWLHVQGTTIDDSSSKPLL